MVILADEASPGGKPLPDNITEDATLFVVVVFLCPVDLLNHVSRNNRERNELGVGVIHAGPRRLAVVFKKEDEPKALVFFKVQHPVPVAPQDLLELLVRHVGGPVELSGP